MKKKKKRPIGAIRFAVAEIHWLGATREDILRRSTTCFSVAAVIAAWLAASRQGWICEFD